MKTDAHYYAVLAFARACGFTKNSAYQIAYASQFVDDALINHIVLRQKPGRKIEYQLIDKKPAFFNMATSHAYTRIKTFNYDSMINNTCAFHFVPACKGKNFDKRMRCSEDSPVIAAILEAALKDNNLIKFGMVLHPFADTFSHQGFSGLISKVNDIRQCKPISKIPLSRFNKMLAFFKSLIGNRFDRYLDKLMPAYGHGQAFDYPDLPHLKWSYSYDYSDEFSDSYKFTGAIDNQERYSDAFKKIKKYLKQYLAKHPEYLDADLKFDNFDILFNTLFQRKTDQQRIKNWQTVLVKTSLFEADDPELSYDASEWIRLAFSNYDKKKFNDRKVENVELAAGFEYSYWYRYYQAVKWYKREFFKQCKKNKLVIPT